MVRPDTELPTQVAGDPGGIGPISFSFLNGAAKGVRALEVDGHQPTVTNFDYPIARPLYLLHLAGDPAVEAFVRWTRSDAGQRVVMRHFVGVRVAGSVEAKSDLQRVGTLIVYTETTPVLDGGIFYYPHRSYSVLTRQGVPVRRVPNHRGQNDERPMRIRLPEGVYLVRTELDGQGIEFFVRIESGKSTVLDVEHPGGDGR